jgi:mono/diheme cytochrome c family protein
MNIMLTHLTKHSIFGLAVTSLLLVSIAEPTVADDLARGAEVFAANCAACHGPDGGPDADSPLVQSLGVEPANFSDPLFNSREPASTWKMVITHGGAAMGFSEMMPAFGESLSEQDIDAVLAHIKTLGGEHDYPDGELNLFLPIRTKKAFPEDEWVWKQRYTGQDGDNAWKNTGFKYVLKHDRRAGFILTGAAQVGVPLNSGANWEFLPYLAFGKILSPQWTIQGSGRLKFDLEDSDGSSAELASIIHWVHSDWGRAVFPALEVVAEVPFERGSGPDKKDAVQWSVLPQARIGLNKRGNIALNAGLELPLNDRDGRYDWRAYVYFIWDFADGGLFDGW